MKKHSHHDGASDVEAIMPDTKPQPRMVFPKKVKSIISNNLDWTESTVPGEICWQNKNVMRTARAGEDVITRESKSAR
jgi:hypothetical protein